MRDVEEIRKEINEIDREIAKLLSKRMECVCEETEAKKEKQVPFFRPKQEAEQKEEQMSLYVGHPYEAEKKEIFKTIFTMERRVQARELLSANIALIGFMGCGKSTISSYLQKMLALDLAEVDEMIVEREGMSINEIFAQRGEQYFRDVESRIALELQERELTIISCGGGLVMRPENVTNLKKNSKIVLLTAKPETIYQRVKDSDNRPILNGHMNVEYIAGLMEKRRAVYEAAADLVISTDGRRVQDICEELIQKIR